MCPMATKLTAKTKLEKDMLMSFYDKNFRKRMVGRVVRIIQIDTPIGPQELFHIMMRPSFEAYGNKQYFINKNAKIISVDELIALTNDTIIEK